MEVMIPDGCFVGDPLTSMLVIVAIIVIVLLEQCGVFQWSVPEPTQPKRDNDLCQCRGRRRSSGHRS